MTTREAVDTYARETTAQRGAMVSRYLDFAGDIASALEDRTFARWLRSLGEANLKPSTVDLHARTVRAWCRRFGMTPPKGKVAFNADVDSERPAVSRETVLQLLATLPRQRPFAAGTLALSAVYGLRAVELAAVRAQDVQPGRILVRTAKGGIERWCYLPPEVAAWLPESWPPRTANGMQAVWKVVWAEALGAKPPARVGWHAIRRALVRDLRGAGCSPAAVVKFMRWKAGQERDEGYKTLGIYERSNQVVTAGGKTARPAEDLGLREADAEVWGKHPYLSAIAATAAAASR